MGSHSFFESDLLPLDRTIALPDPTSSAATSSDQGYKWQPLPPFAAAVPFPTADSRTCFIVHAPGHLPGHINLLCRVDDPSKETADGARWVYLAGDACHDIRLFTGERDIATWLDAEGRACCIHADREMTKETLRRMRQAHEEGFELPKSDSGDVKEEGEQSKGEQKKEKSTVEVVFAHNWAWEADAKREGRFWPGRL